MNLYGVLRAPQLVLDDIKLLRDLRVINYINSRCRWGDEL